MIASLLNILVPKKNLPAEDLILSHYRGVTRKKSTPLRPLGNETLSSVCHGLGDTMMLTDVPAAAAKQGRNQSVFSPSQHFLHLMQFNPYYRDTVDKAYLLNAPDLVRIYDSGNGHYLQRLRRVFGLKADDRPRGFLKWHGQRHRNRVILHFDAGVHAQWQRKRVHKQARMIYAKTRAAIKQFVSERRDLEFVEVGNSPLLIEGTRHLPSKNTYDLVNLMATGEWFLGIISGPMHVATALGLKGIVIINFPDPNKIFPPTVVPTGQIEEEWFYPQHVHLHQDNDGPLVKLLTLDNLKRAFNGELYPYWSDKYLGLIHEKI